jgi:hypothetical protein
MAIEIGLVSYILQGELDVILASEGGVLLAAEGRAFFKEPNVPRAKREKFKDQGDCDALLKRTSSTPARSALFLFKNQSAP